MTVKIIKNIPIEFDLEKLLSVLGRAESAERFREDAIWSIDTIASVSQPRLLVDYFKIKITQPDTLVVFSDNDPKLAELVIGDRGIELMGEARIAQISFITLGQEIQDLGEELHRQGENLRRYILDVAAILALAQAGQRASCLAEDQAKARGWGVGRRISPGDLNGWSVIEQIVLGKLLPVGDIGISVSESGLLTPLKSASGLIGLGPGYPQTNVGTICRWCKNKKNCPIFLSLKSSPSIDTSPI